MGGRLSDIIQQVRDNERVNTITSFLPPLNFITIHYYYFIFTSLIFSLIFWGSSNPEKSVSYTDSLFMVISAMTEAGLNTVNLSQISTFQQILLWLLIVIGSSIFVSIFTVLTRKRVFEKRFQNVVELQKSMRRLRPSRRMSMSTANGDTRLSLSAEAIDRGAGEDEPSHEDESNDPHPTATDAENSGTQAANQTLSPTSTVGGAIRFASVGGGQETNALRSPYSNGIYRRGRKPEMDEPQDQENVPHHSHYPSYLTRHTTGRNAQFFGLSKEEREHLGGVEYRAITLLAWIVPIYFTLWQLLGCIGLGAYMAHNKADTARSNGIHPWWLGIFNGVSAFNNSGMSLLDLNMIPFQTSPYTLITMGLLIIAGNTAYPLFLRLIIWSAYKLLEVVYPHPDQYPHHKATLKFILKYPRRVYTNLFPSTASWWLLLMLFCLNGIDWAAFELLNIGNANTVVIPTGYRVLDGLFQALAVRSGGFYIISIPSLRIGLQVLYVIMMYISVYPVVITIRHSNVYEERSLGIYADEEEADHEAKPPKLGHLAGKLRRTFTSTFKQPFPMTPASHTKNTGTEFVRQQIRGQLAHDLWWLAVAVLLISCIEVSNFNRDPVTYSVFNILFEVVSAYGCVGISTGLPNEAYSFSGGWHVCSKLILCAVMLRGRHRGLPVSLDRAVRLPGVDPGVMEEEDQMVRRRSMSMIRTPHIPCRTPHIIHTPLMLEPANRNAVGLGLKQM